MDDAKVVVVAYDAAEEEEDSNYPPSVYVPSCSSFTPQSEMAGYFKHMTYN